MIALSPQQRQIIELMCDDLNRVQIAFKLGVTEQTIATQVGRMKVKFGRVKTLYGLVAVAMRHGMGKR